MLIALILLAAAPQDVVLYKARSAPVPTPQCFVTPTPVDAAILNPPGFRWTAGAAAYDL